MVNSVVPREKLLVLRSHLVIYQLCDFKEVS